MKNLLFILAFIGYIVCTHHVAQCADNSQSMLSSQLINGLEKNDAQAFAEVARLPIEQGAPALLGYVNEQIANPERAQRARDALRTMPGFVEYMKRRILEKRRQAGGDYQMVEFKMLKAIGGDKGAAAAAPFLFVNDPPLLGIMDDYSAGPIRDLALTALTGMHLPDAPKGDDLREWRAWAEKKGYRDTTIPPMMTLEQKGVSASVAARSNALWTRGLALAAAGQNVTPPSGYQPSAQVSPSVSKARSATPLPPSKKSFAPHFIFGLIGILAVVCAAAIILWLRRKS